MPLEILRLMALQDLIICMNHGLFTLSSYTVYVDCFQFCSVELLFLERGIDWRDDQSRDPVHPGKDSYSQVTIQILTS